MARRKRKRRGFSDSDLEDADIADITTDIDLLRGLIGTLAAFPRSSAQRGKSYAESGRVPEMEYWGFGATATVRGQREYETTWDAAFGEWIPSCDCPVAPQCKHAFAVGLVILNYELPHLPPDCVRAVTALLLRADGAPNSVAEPSPFRPSGSLLAGGFASAERAVEILRGGAILSLRRAALSELIEGSPLDGHFVYEIGDELNETDPDLRCMRLASAIESRSSGWVPTVLRPYLARADLAERMNLRRQEEARRQLLGWLERDRPVPKRMFRAELALSRDYRGRFGIELTIRVTSARLDDDPRSIEQVRQAWSETCSDEDGTTAEQRMLLDWVVRGSSFDSGYGYGALGLNGWMLRSLDRFQHSSLVRWAPDTDAEIERRAGIVAGSPVRWSSQTVRLEPHCRSSGRETRLGLSYAWPDGTARSLDECLRLEMPDRRYGAVEAFLISGGVIHETACELPADVVSAFAVTPEIEIDAASRGPVLTRLAQRVPSVEAELARHTRFHPVVPFVTLDLRADDWLQLRLFAATDEEWTPPQAAGNGVLFEFVHGSGWVRIAGDPASGRYDPISAAEATAATSSDDRDDVAVENFGVGDSIPDDEVWDEAPRIADVALALEWLRSLEVHPGDRGRRECPWDDRTIGWWLFARGKAMARLADAWAAVPRGARFFGTDAARRLFDRGRRVTPRIKVAASGLDWFEVSATWQAEGLVLSDEDVAVLRKATTRFVRLPSGWVRREVATEQDEVASILADLGVEAGGAPARMSMLALAGARPGTIDALGSFGADDETMVALRRLRDRIADFKGVPRLRKPRGFRGELRPYQRDGLDFLAYAAGLQLGAVLADDMGLGKTIQTLAWLQWLRDTDPGGGPALVVCPASVTHNWIDEAAQFTPKLKVLLLDRGSERRQRMKEIEGCDLAITNYALLRRDVAAWREVRLRALILDEAQNVKNPDAAVTRAVRSVAAKYRLALTGTPIENRALDLWSIVDCLNPGYLGARGDFASRFDGLEVAPHRRVLLAAKLRPILLRRSKSEVAPELPERIEESRRCEMTPGQRRLYLAELARSRKLIDDLDEEPESLGRNKMTILAALTRLRQICCHPALVGGEKSLGSGKFDELFNLLEPLLEEGHKVLVFSQFVESLKLLQTELTKRKIRQYILTGKTVKRAEVVDSFKNDSGPSVFLISLKAGGTGLNLTSASYVVLFDPWWNPAVEAQAIDRTHRIGQDRTVIAYRLVTEGTIEEKIRELQRRKESLVRDVLGEGGFARSLTRDDLSYLLEPS